MITNYLRPKRNYRVHLGEQHNGRASHLGYMLMGLTALIVLTKMSKERRQPEPKKISEKELSKTYETLIRGMALL